jgi:diguanylate cyclase (GGDEF)-like protein
MYSIGEVAVIVGLPLLALCLAGGIWFAARKRVARLRTRETVLLQSEERTERVQAVVENMEDGFLVFDQDWSVSYANAGAGKVLGQTFRHLVAGADGRGLEDGGSQARQFRIVVHEPDPADPGAPAVVLDRWIQQRSYATETGHAVYLHDATERKQLEERIRTSSLLDDLTGLHNRRGFLTLAEQHLKLAERTGRNVLLIFADLDNFKSINDEHGHQEGDRALVAAARTLREVFRDSDILARIGGDEFVVLALETTDTSGDLLARRMRERLAATSQEIAREYELSVSIGIARWDPRSPSSIADLLARADSLMYEHKRQKTIRRLAQA